MTYVANSFADGPNSDLILQNMIIAKLHAPKILLENGKIYSVGAL
jgi:hypothetical protein